MSTTKKWRESFILNKKLKINLADHIIEQKDEISQRFKEVHGEEYLKAFYYDRKFGEYILRINRLKRR